MPRALVVGGGIAGPAVAQLLTATGWEALVLDDRPGTEDEEGLFLSLAVNGRRILRMLCLEDRLLEDAHPAPSLVMWGSGGKQLGVVPTGPAGRPADGGVVVRRSWLQRVLHEGAERSGVELRRGQRVASVTAGEGVAAVTLADGSTEEADVVIGADGVGSVARRYVAPEARPAFTGLLGTGGFSVVPGLGPTPGRQHVVFGRRAFFGYLVRDDATCYWFANLSAAAPPSPDESAIGSAALLSRLRDLHADDPCPVPQILAHTRAELRAYPIFRLDTVSRWSRGRVVLAGDAVHATSPSAGQGASLALEDAGELAAALRDWTCPLDAFTAYERGRRERVEAIVAHAAAIDRRKRVPTSRIGAALRDALLPTLLRRAAGDTRQDWLYDHEPRRSEQAW
ncbi:FAD-dependent oxidoreductase [Nocardioides coralli]|uniref:FAD-dependent oxidoreductase n=1 Tax=Nocardioides coralli TaxID=2872154 RepID=UPI001CA39387|nr:NAD(P)/FAD-dependent oxidoreductase [Nocardioides coralli]QZY28992.1 FAD-dependent monooxygenase [Nocardioides coralli]